MEGTSRFIAGPIFGNIVLADELNRTTPRTQSAMLEAMQEHQVTIEGKTYPLAMPFLVIATQVHSGGEGTYVLTDVQLDRFMLRATSGYSSKDEEKQVLNKIDMIDNPDIKVVTSLAEVMEAQKLVKTVQVSPDIAEYIVSIIDVLRADPDIASGLSMRAGIAIYKCARVLALMDGRSFVIPDDVKELVFPAIEHRIKVKSEAEMDGITPQAILNRVMEKMPVPKPSM
jgi:MoxR-like ATPase